LRCQASFLDLDSLLLRSVADLKQILSKFHDCTIYSTKFELFFSVLKETTVLSFTYLMQEPSGKQPLSTRDKHAYAPSSATLEFLRRTPET
jgi:hypothetical protein